MSTQTFERTRRADWLLFRMHYLRTLVPLVIGCFGLFALVFILTRILGAMRPDARDDLRSILDAVAAALATLIALPTGASVFSRAFKEQHVLFFHALPISRLRQWLLFAASSAAALLTIYAGFLILRPSWIPAVARAETAAVAGAIALLTFASGLCFSLVFARPILAYVAAYMAAVLVPFLSVIPVIAPGVMFYSREPGLSAHGRRLIETFESVSGSLLWVIAVGISIVFIMLSALFYVRGETTLPRIQLRNFAITIGASLIAAVLIAKTGAAMLADEEVRGGSYRVSPDGRTIAIARRPGTPWKTELELFDAASGARLTHLTLPGNRAIAFNPSGELLLVNRELSLLRRLTDELPDRIDRRTRDGKLVSSEKLPGHLYDVELRPDGMMSATLTDRDLGHIVTIQPDGRVRELARSPAPASIHMRQSVVYFFYPSLPLRIWRIRDDRAEEIRAGDWNDDTIVFGDAAFPNPRALTEHLERNFPVPREAGARVRYGIRQSDEMRVVFARSGTSLYAFDGTRWKLVANDVIEQTSSLVHLTRPDDRVLYAQRRGDAVVHCLYDATTDRTIEVYTQPQPDARSLTLVARGDILEIEPRGGGPAIAEFQLVNERAIPLKRWSDDSLLEVLDGGRQLRGGKGRFVVWSADGTSRVLGK